MSGGGRKFCPGSVLSSRRLPPSIFRRSLLNEALLVLLPACPFSRGRSAAAPAAVQALGVSRASSLGRSCGRVDGPVGGVSPCFFQWIGLPTVWVPAVSVCHCPFFFHGANQPRPLCCLLVCGSFERSCCCFGVISCTLKAAVRNGERESGLRWVGVAQRVVCAERCNSMKRPGLPFSVHGTRFPFANSSTCSCYQPTPATPVVLCFRRNQVCWLRRYDRGEEAKIEGRAEGREQETGSGQCPLGRRPQLLQLVPGEEDESVPPAGIDCLFQSPQALVSLCLDRCSSQLGTIVGGGVYAAVRLGAGKSAWKSENVPCPCAS